MKAKHRDAIVNILKYADVFNEEELVVAVELVDSYLKGEIDYIIRVAVDDKESVEGYICYGRTPFTNGVYHLYWIAVGLHRQRKGIGKELMKFMENEIVPMGGRMILLETSSTEKYKASRKFYTSNGYILAACIEDFYKIDDDLYIYAKYLKR